MTLRLAFPALVAVAFIAGCSSNAIAPNYTTENPDIMRIGEDRPADPERYVEEMGSYCVEVEETWNDHGTTPDGQTLWAKDTARSVIPCD
nr:hypothetical protein [Halomonas socia]